MLYLSRLSTEIGVDINGETAAKNVFKTLEGSVGMKVGIYETVCGSPDLICVLSLVRDNYLSSYDN